MENKILLGNGKFTMIDEDDYKNLSQWKWSCSYNGYAWRRVSLGYVNGKRKRAIIFMHRFIMNTPSDMITDHINGDKLDNRKSNLRICTYTQNSRNSISKRGSSKYKGVYLDKSENRWVAQIVVNKKTKFLGRYNTQEEAASIYNNEAKKQFGEFSRVNNI